MMAEDTEQNDSDSAVDLQEFAPEENSTAPGTEENLPATTDESAVAKRESHSASELEAVFDVPVNISAVLGKTQMDVSTLLKLSKGTAIELDRKVGEAIDIFVNDRLVARGEVVLIEEQLGITMTEIIQAE